MIPTSTAETMSKALGALALKSPPNGIAEAALRIQRVVKTYAGDDDAYNPVDFTESDLSEAIKVFETAARKEIHAFESAAKEPNSTFRTSMNEAQDSKARIKARCVLVLDLIVAVAKKL